MAVTKERILCESAEVVPSRPRTRHQPALAVISLCLFFCVNAAFLPVYQHSSDRDGMSYVVGKFQALNNEISTVFIGSSVAKHVVESIAPEEAQKLHIASLAYNMQIPSDGFILINELVSSKKPKRVVFCVSPRDFCDNDAPELMNTTTFKRRVHLVDLPKISSVLHMSLKQSLQSSIGKLCPLYEARASFQKRLYIAMEKVYLQLGVPAKMLSQRDDPWTHSLKEYAWRYTGIGIKESAPQLAILRESINLCKKLGIQVLLVNVPLSHDNVQLLPAGFYTQYKDSLLNTSENCHVDFLDLSSMPLETEDFVDCAHLNHKGGQKVMSVLRPYISDENKHVSP